MSHNKCSLYIHWPFCPTRCSYCPFVALACHDDHMERYHLALCKEIALFAEKNPHCTISTIYFGGGTPSTYPANLLLDISGRIYGVFNTDQLKEVTIEVNPGTVTAGLLDTWLAAGITRLSVGVQYGDESVLGKLNRYQTMEDVAKFFVDAQLKFENISIDLMLGLPGVNGKQWKNFVAQAVEFPIKHISLYCLMVHENTPLYFKVERNEIEMPEEELIAELYCWSVDYLAHCGFCQYEVSNFARPGYESRHNNVYWDRKPYKGFGLGACSFDGKRRFTNESSLIKYCEALERGQVPVAFMEELTIEQVRIEKIMLGLRRNMGIHYQTILEDLSFDKCRSILKKIEIMCSAGLLEQTEKIVRLTPGGCVVEQAVIAQLI